MLLNRAVVTTFAATVPFLLPFYAIGLPGPLGPGPRSAREAVTDVRSGHLKAEGSQQARRSKPARPSVAAYEGLAAWIDIYNHHPWRHPGRAITRMKRRGVRTLFLQTANYGLDTDVYKPQATGRFLRAAHERNIRVVAWYVPSFASPHRDLRRTMAAIRFRSGAGHRFDSFAMDIEATVVRDIRTRNQRLRELSRKVRARVGRGYSLGAIVPDVGSQYWPNFPYRSLGRRYDVFLPMAYYSFRTTGYRSVMNYTRANINKIRRLTGKRSMPVHMIGGLAGSTSIGDLRGFLRGVKRYRAVGASLYDFPITDTDEWQELRRFSGKRPARGDKAPSRKAASKTSKRPNKAGRRHDSAGRSGKAGTRKAGSGREGAGSRGPHRPGVQIL